MKSISLQDNIIIFSLATLVNIINRNVLRFEEININEKDGKNILKEKRNNSENELYNNGYLSGIESNDVLITELNSESGLKKNHEIEEFKIKEIDEEENKKNKIEKNIMDISTKNKNQFRFKTLGVKKGAKIIKKGILKKKGNENGGKKPVEIKTINEEKQKEEEESLKEINNEKEIEETKLKEEDYQPLPESEKEIAIVDYIIEKVPNILDIIKGLFNKGSTDISSLTIMLCCNLIRKLRFSKYNNFQPELIKCVDDYIKNESLLNDNENNSSIFKTDSGKFLYISLIKYFICLSIENIEEFLINNLQKSNIVNIIMNNMKEPNSPTLKRIKQFKLSLNDIRENSLNFALVENQLTLINLILLLIKQKNIKYFFGYKSSNEIREYISIFYEDFIKNFSNLLVNIKKDDEEQRKINEINKIELIKEESNNESENNNSNDEYINNKKNKKEKKVVKNEEGTISKNQTVQNILISILKIMVEYLVDFDYFNKSQEEKDKSLLSKKELNIIFYNKISKYFETILDCIIKEKIELLSGELKSLFIYILYLILTYDMGKNEANTTNYSVNRQTGSMRNSVKKIRKKKN